MISGNRYNMNWLLEEEDEDFKCLSGDFFDDIFNNHIDFSLEDMETTNGEGDWDAKFQELESPLVDMFSSLPSNEFTSCGISKKKQSNSSEALSSINITDFHQSSSPPDFKVSKLFQSSSPVSVLESIDGSFCPQNAILPRLSFIVKGMRSKRKRPTKLRFRYIFPFESKKLEKLTPGESEYGSCYSSEQHAEKKRKIHPVFSSLEASNSDEMVWKCTHCETTKTPQWREGPNGPKTLCNACGVRFRSGRLVPEYRPASSPTFIPSVHSNSHRRIIEMRRKDEDQFDTGGDIRSIKTKGQDSFEFGV